MSCYFFLTKDTIIPCKTKRIMFGSYSVKLGTERVRGSGGHFSVFRYCSWFPLAGFPGSRVSLEEQVSPGTSGYRVIPVWSLSKPSTQSGSAGGVLGLSLVLAGRHPKPLVEDMSPCLAVRFCYPQERAQGSIVNTTEMLKDRLCFCKKITGFVSNLPKPCMT